jgi:asparagine synthase (glutamine-hydrolysing)
MCGLLGIALGGAQEQAAVARLFPDALATLRHRGPDAHGEYKKDGVWLGHARLSILDLSDAGRQPMQTPDGRFVISYNGEVYNFRELARAHALTDLRSGSDTEVVLQLFAKLGVGSFAQLNGMFALALYDARERKLWLVRDRIGIKPLYFRLTADSLACASEIKAIRALETAAAECEISALHEWVYYGNPLGGRTLYRGIRQLLPGHCLELDLRTFRHSIQPYWTLEEQAGKGSTAPPDARLAVEETRRLLEQAVRRQLVSDVPVGLFLSGGVDSSAVAALASRHYAGRLATYSVGFDFARGAGELPRARRVAEHFGTDHHEIHIRGASVGELVQRLVHHHDMPFADAANIPLALMAGKISEHTKVVLQGDGGDEVFGGYSRYFTLDHYKFLRLPALVAQHVHRLTPESAFHYRVRRYVRALAAQDMATTMALLLTSEDRSMQPEAIFAQPLRALVASFDPFARHRECLAMLVDQDRINQMSFLDLMITLPDTYLEKVDRSTMAASLEVRVPFLDNDLVDFAVSLPGSAKTPGGKQKWLLKTALAGIVPDEVLQGPKTGLEVPYGAWLQGPLKPLFFDQLSTFSRQNRGVLDTGYIERLFARTGAGVRDDSYMLWKVLNFMIWANDSRVRFGAAVAA